MTGSPGPSHKDSILVSEGRVPALFLGGVPSECLAVTGLLGLSSAAITRATHSRSDRAIPPSGVRRWGAGTAAVVRLLVASDVPMTGVAISMAVGVTQPRGSQVLKQLADLNAVTATPDGYLGEPSTLLDLYRARTRPHLVEPESYWYSTRPLTEQAERSVLSPRTTKSRSPPRPTSPLISSHHGATPPSRSRTSGIG